VLLSGIKGHFFPPSLHLKSLPPSSIHLKSLPIAHSICSECPSRLYRSVHCRWNVGSVVAITLHVHTFLYDGRRICNLRQRRLRLCFFSLTSSFHDCEIEPTLRQHIVARLHHKTGYVFAFTRGVVFANEEADAKYPEDEDDARDHFLERFIQRVAKSQAAKGAITYQKAKGTSVAWQVSRPYL